MLNIFAHLQRMKTANFYRNRPNELNKTLLHVIPDSPRVPQSGLPSNYNWAMFDGEANHTIKAVSEFNHFSKKQFRICFIFL